MKDITLLQNNGVDLSHAMQALGNMAVYDETIQRFANAIEYKPDKLKQYKENHDLNNYADTMSKLEEISDKLGFTKLAFLSNKHVMAARYNDLSYIEMHFDELVVELFRILAVAGQYIGHTTNDNVRAALIVADDSAIIRTFINKIFSQEYEILQAEDGNQVIEIIEQNRDKHIVGLLLDLNMPRSNGFAVLDYFKQNNLFATIPVSLITGDDSKDSIDKAFQYPIVDMLSKPFGENAARIIVEKTVSRAK